MIVKRFLTGMGHFTVNAVKGIKNLAVMILKGMGALTLVLLVAEIVVVTANRLRRACERRRWR